MAKSSSATQRSIRHNIFAGMTVFVILAGAVAGWAGTTALSGALIAPGQVVVDSNVKKVQHPTGGVVGELRVRDGDRVKGGEIVMRLDQTVTRSNLAIEGAVAPAGRAAPGRDRRHDRPAARQEAGG